MSLLNYNDATLKRTATIFSITVAILLSFIKVVAALITGSLSILSSMIDSLSDVISSFISYIAVHYSNKPLTDKHRYGYGKAEALSALIQTAFIVGSASFILYDGFYRFKHPVKIEQTSTGLLVMLISLFLTLILVFFQKYVVKKTSSKAIAADSLHYAVDILSNFAVILSLIIIKYENWQWFDILTALIIAAYSMYNAIKLAINSLEEITDKEIDETIKNDIIDVIKSVDEVKGFHDFRSRVSGNRIFVEIHLEFSGNKTLFETHQKISVIENKIIAKYPHMQLIIQQDPWGIQEERIDNIIKGSL